jgi:hypothetical protein
MSHFSYTLLLASSVSIALAEIGNRPRRERVYAGIYILTTTLLGIFAGSWFMYLVHR